MADSTLESIKKGKGLPPLKGGDRSPKDISRTTTKQRGRKGLTIETFELEKKDK